MLIGTRILTQQDIMKLDITNPIALYKPHEC